MSALASVTSRRAWFVPDLVVWGLAGLGEVQFLTIESVDGVNSVQFCLTDIGTGEQSVSYSQLIDHRGNQLPATISAPRVIVRPKSENAAFVVGQESPGSFKIARDPKAASAVTVDLLILEMND